MAKKSHKLVVELIEAVDLPAKDKEGTSDPYVVLKVGGREVGETKVVQKTLNPKWNEKFTVDVLDPLKEQVEFFIYDKDFIGKDAIGSVSLGLGSLFFGKRAEFDLPIKLTEKHTKVSKLKLALTAQDFGPKDNSAEIEQQHKKEEEQKRQVTQAQAQEEQKRKQQAQAQEDQKRQHAQAEQKRQDADNSEAAQRSLYLIVGVVVVGVAALVAYKYLKKD